MKEIPLSQGKTAIIDDEDFDLVAPHNWFFAANGYAVRNTRKDGKRSQQYLHRLVCGEPDSLVDHINRNRLDCRRSNLRLVDWTGNALNRGKQSNNRSGYTGVVWHAFSGLWQARLQIRRRVHCLGYFKTPEDAHAARLAGERKLLGT